MAGRVGEPKLGAEVGFRVAVPSSRSSENGLLGESGSAMVTESGELLYENPVAVASAASVHIESNETHQAHSSEVRCERWSAAILCRTARGLEVLDCQTPRNPKHRKDFDPVPLPRIPIWGSIEVPIPTARGASRSDRSALSQSVHQEIDRAASAMPSVSPDSGVAARSSDRCSERTSESQSAAHRSAPGAARLRIADPKSAAFLWSIGMRGKLSGQHITLPIHIKQKPNHLRRLTLPFRRSLRQPSESPGINQRQRCTDICGLRLWKLLLK